MSQPGLGVLIGYLGGNAESVDAFTKGVGKTIESVSLEEDALKFRFVDGYEMFIADDGQSCCEHRYMRTDDDLASFAGSVFVGAEVKDAPNEADEYGEHEVQFLEVKTSKGSFTMASHNEHNGYYGGFLLRARAA